MVGAASMRRRTSGTPLRRAGGRAPVGGRSAAVGAGGRAERLAPVGGRTGWYQWAGEPVGACESPEMARRRRDPPFGQDLMPTSRQNPLERAPDGSRPGPRPRSGDCQSRGVHANSHGACTGAVTGRAREQSRGVHRSRHGACTGACGAGARERQPPAGVGASTSRRGKSGSAAATFPRSVACAPHASSPRIAGPALPSTA